MTAARRKIRIRLPRKIAAVAKVKALVDGCTPGEYLANLAAADLARGPGAPFTLYPLADRGDARWLSPPRRFKN